MIIPMAIAISVVVMLLRPIYVLTMCDLYSDYLDEKGEEAALPDNPSKGRTALIAFILMCVMVLFVSLLRDEIGLTDRLNTPIQSQNEKM